MSAKVGAALAHSNIALSKYWGKRDYPGNYPATPSLSVTLDALTTRTKVTFDPRLPADTFELGGQRQTGTALARVKGLLDRVRQETGTGAFAEVVSKSDFPTASGLASSASGFAALALAAVGAQGLDWDLARISDLARRSSASAARSLYAGWVELPAAPFAETREPLAARAVAGPGHVDWRLVIAVCGEGAKAVGSTSGMEATRAASPFYDAWLDFAPRVHAELLGALAARDFDRFGAAAERSALSMHASAFAAGVVYVKGVTLDVLAAVRGLRARGVAAYATMDAGPHVKVLCRPLDAPEVEAALEALGGVTRVLVASPAEGARVIAAEPW
jgi:diphosphomevalonate decarboxylase